MTLILLRYWKFAVGAVPVALIAFALHGWRVDAINAAHARQIAELQVSIVKAAETGAKARERAENATKSLTHDDVVRGLVKHGWLRNDADR